MRLTEIHASTKPYPHWWTDVEETRVLRRRKSSIDTVLERNICFVDTPGYMEGSEQDDMNLVTEYCESQLQQTASVITLDEGKMVEVISGSGGILVDVILYLLPPSEFMTSVHRTNADNVKTKTLPRMLSLCSGCLLFPMSYLSSQSQKH